MLLTAAALLGIVVVLAIGVWRGRYQRTTHRQVVTGIGVVYIGLTGWIFIVRSRDLPELLRSDLFVFGLVLLLYAATAWIRQSVGPGRAENPGKAPPNRAAPSPASPRLSIPRTPPSKSVLHLAKLVSVGE